MKASWLRMLRYVRGLHPDAWVNIDYRHPGIAPHRCNSRTIRALVGAGLAEVRRLNDEAFGDRMMRLTNAGRLALLSHPARPGKTDAEGT